MKNKFILSTAILFIIAGAGLLELNLEYLSTAFLGVGILLFIFFPLVCDFINDGL
jgi:hypothetical protein